VRRDTQEPNLQAGKGKHQFVTRLRSAIGSLRLCETGCQAQLEALLPTRKRIGCPGFW
jgi:hypothetical protein